MNLRQCFLTGNECYYISTKIIPKGVMVHSTGANNPRISRYVQPDDGYLGTNIYANHWNVFHPDGENIAPHSYIGEDGRCAICGGRQVCAHAFIGRLENGDIATYQTLPWDVRGWHAGRSSGNDAYIGFEICEDALRDSSYFNLVYQEAVELTAYLCSLFRLNPLEEGVVISHREGNLMGVASDHEDVEHWFSRFGKTMDNFRHDVKQKLKKASSDEEEAENKEMTIEEMTNVAGTGDNPSEWAKAATDFCKEQGIFLGDSNGNFGWQQPITREAVAQVLYNILKK